jgi:hypothetical protein
MTLADSPAIRDRYKKLLTTSRYRELSTGAQIALAVNADHESNIDPSAVNSSSGAGGLWQWLPYSGKVTLGDWVGQVAYMLDTPGQYIAHSGWWAGAGVAEPASLANVNSWDDFKKSNASAVDLTIGFIGNWERPGYSEGIPRINEAADNVALIKTWAGAGPTLQVPQWPFPTQGPLYFTQSAYSKLQIAGLGYDHAFYPAYDMQIAGQTQVPVIAPVDMTVQKSYWEYHSLYLVSTNEVQRADGSVGRLGFVFAHSDSQADYPAAGTKFKQGNVFFHTGTGGIATGDHLHMSQYNIPQSGGFGYRPAPYNANIGDGEGSPVGNSDGDDANLPNQFTTKQDAANRGGMTANNVYSVTDEQKARMSNQLGANVNIAAFHYFAGGDAPAPPEPKPTGKPKHSKPLQGAAVFSGRR